MNRHNIALDDLPLAIEELKDFSAQGERTVVDPTCRGIGRDPVKLRAISVATGLNIVMGAGYYLHTLMPACSTSSRRKAATLLTPSSAT